jgi:hypothetical protein
VAQHFSIAGEIGFQLYEFKKPSIDTSFIDKQGWKGSVEVRYYLSSASSTSESALTGTYAGVNFFYRQNKYNSTIDYTKPNDNKVYKDCFWVNRKVKGANFVLGTQMYVSSGLVIDLYTGIGIMNRQSQNFNREYNDVTDKIKLPTDFSIQTVFNHNSLQENNGWKGNFNLGCRIGIRLN